MHFVLSYRHSIDEASSLAVKSDHVASNGPDMLRPLRQTSGRMQEDVILVDCVVSSDIFNSSDKSFHLLRILSNI